MKLSVWKFFGEIEKNRPTFSFSRRQGCLGKTTPNNSVRIPPGISKLWTFTGRTTCVLTFLSTKTIPIKISKNCK